MEAALKLQSVVTQVELVIYAGHTIVGYDHIHAARAYGISRNAECDAAYSVLQKMHQHATNQEIHALLKRQAKGFTLDQQGAPLDRSRPAQMLYYAARQRQAQLLLRRLKKVDASTLRRTVHFLATRKKTVLKTF